MTPADEHRRIAARFTDLVEGTPPNRWNAPTPVKEWRARDVVGHLVSWFPGFLKGGTGIEIEQGPPASEDPVKAWQVQRDAVQALLDDPATGGLVYRSTMMGEIPLAQAIDRFYTADVFMHSWDLAVATGQDATLDPEKCTVLLEGLKRHEELIRDSDQYGDEVPVPEDADVQTRLLGFIGRDPFWQPPVN